MQRWFQYYYFIIFGKSALSDVIVILTNMKRRAGPVAIAVLHVSPKLYPLQPTSIWWPRWRWPHWNLANIFGIQLSTVVFHILLRRLPLQKRVTLLKIGGHMVFDDSQSGSFRTVIPQSILRIPESRSMAWQHTEHSILTTEPYRLDNSVQVTTIYN